MKLQFTDIVVKNHKSVLTEPLHFSVETGTTTAVLGASKSGKSTLLLYGAGQIQPNQGSVRIFDDNMQSASPDWARVGIGPIQSFAPLFETLTVQEHLLFHGKLHRVRGMKRRLEELLTDYSLHEVRKERVKDIDRFAYARLSIAITIVHHPGFILLDEPESGLTENEWKELIKYLEDLQCHDTGVLFTTVLESATAAAQQTVVLPGGEVRTTWPFSRSSALSGDEYGAIN